MKCGIRRFGHANRAPKRQQAGPLRVRIARPNQSVAQRLHMKLFIGAVCADPLTAQRVDTKSSARHSVRVIPASACVDRAKTIAYSPRASATAMVPGNCC